MELKAETTAYCLGLLMTQKQQVDKDFTTMLGGLMQIYPVVAWMRMFVILQSGFN